MKAYVEFEILEGAYEISCPDALCPYQGVMDIEQDIAALVSSDLVEKHKRFRLNRGKVPERFDFCNDLLVWKNHVDFISYSWFERAIAK